MGSLNLNQKLNDATRFSGTGPSLPTIAFRARDPAMVLLNHFTFR
jgi:hypothetical protein